MRTRNGFQPVCARRDHQVAKSLKPVVAWHRKGFRLFWTWKVRHGQPGRPVISRELRDLIRKMCRENPSWVHHGLYLARIKSAFKMNNIQRAEHCYMACGSNEITFRHAQVGRQGGNLSSNRAGGAGSRPGGGSASNRASGGIGAGNRPSGGGANQIGGRDLSRSGGGNRDAFGGGSRGSKGQLCTNPERSISSFSFHARGRSSFSL
jgi:hypothetical protein